MNALRVLVLEDDELARVLLREALAGLGTRVSTITETEGVSDCRRCLAEGSFDLFLADLVLPDGLSIDTIRFARSQAPAPTVLVVSSLADEDTVVQAILAGASGYVSKDDPPADMARAIAIAADGGSCISPTIAHRLMEFLRKSSSSTREVCASLTARESEILELAAKGYNYRQIAELFGTQPSTVYTHVRHIYEKLQVCSLPQALFEARLRRLV
jgi:DNA-binding NarL/FixJ family response regulator